MRDRPLLRLALTPRWILALLLALAIAVVFALLGQWQLSRAVANATPSTRPTETVLPLASVASPQQAPTTEAVGQMVSVQGRIAGDLRVLSTRYNGADKGYWLVGRAEVSGGYSLAIALGWSSTEQGAKDAMAAVDTTTEREITGRYLGSESPDGDPEHSLDTTMSVSALVNEWPDVGLGAYAGYLVAADAPAGLAVIDSPEPTQDVSLNLLNLFYAIEWVVFAGLAFFLWFRLLKDAQERQEEDDAEAALLAAEHQHATVD